MSRSVKAGLVSPPNLICTYINQCYYC